MDIHRHRNLVRIFQFIGFMVSLFIFFLSIDFLKNNNVFTPLLFLMGPIITIVIIRLLMIYYFPPRCLSKNCSGKMYLHVTRSRDYSCFSCGSIVKLPRLKDDAAGSKIVNKLLFF